MKEITVEALKNKLDNNNSIFILDVREPFEYQIANLEGTLIPLNDLPDRVDEIEEHKDEPVVVMCRSGNRSAKAAKFLRKNGFSEVMNLKGGINEWAKKIDTSMPVY